MFHLMYLSMSKCVLFFFFNDTATTEIYTLSLHDALPIYRDAPFEPKRRTAAGRAHGQVRDVLADGRPDEGNERAVVRHGRGDEVVGVQRRGRVGTGRAAEEERVLAVGENEQLGDLAAEALRVERGGGQGEPHEKPD